MGISHINHLILAQHHAWLSYHWPDWLTKTAAFETVTKLWSAGLSQEFVKVSFYRWAAGRTTIDL